MKLDNESQINSTGSDPDIVVSPKGKLLTLNAQQMLDYGVADLLILPTKTEPITQEERELGRWPASKMALFHQPFFKDIPNAVISSYKMDWKTRFFAFLATPMVSSLLFLGLILGAYMEFSTPGFGVAGTVAVTCLFLIALSSFSLEIANWLEVILLLAGVAVIFVELFVLPSFGLLGVIGVIFFLMGLFGMMLPGIEKVDYEFDTHTLNAAGQAFFERLAWLCGTLVAAVLAIAVLARYVTPSLARYSRLVLDGNEQDASKGFVSGNDPKTLPQPGTLGRAFATLRPAGKIIIDDVIYDAVSMGSFIERGTSVVVVKLEGGVIVVEDHEKEEEE
jgi:membrane-bound ClpP family serine protease